MRLGTLGFARRGTFCVVCLLALLLPAASAWAAEVVVKNDSFVDGGTAIIVGDFIAGEQAGVRLTATCAGNIVAVQILWLEGTPGHGQSLEQAIHIYNGSTFPTPGTQLAILEGPVMTPGYMNEFRYLDEAQTMPLSVPVTNGQQFYVTLQFDNPTNVGAGGPSVVRDTGCQASKNVIYAIPGGWFNSCLLGVQGDFIIRAVINCQGTGACCRAGGCLATTQANCQTIGGVYAGNGTTCANNICTAGACCKGTGECVQNFGFQCTAISGTFQGPGTSCSPNPCPQPTGACCYGTICIPDQPEADCTSTGGVWVGALTDCGPPDPCNQDPCASVSFTLGDVSGDGLINGLDVQGFVDQYISATPGSVAFCAADMCPDRVIDNSDLSAFVACLLDPTTCGSPSCP
jgi:hypothetical protein